MGKPPFDQERAAFWLVAAVLAVQCVVVLVMVGTCLWWSRAIVEGRFSCAGAADRSTELLVSALAAAIAFGSRRP
jgi:hypothetical protein